MEKLKTMEHLVVYLNKAAKAYYSEGESILSDKEYDSLYEELQQLEEKTGIVLPDSPTQRVGYAVVTELKKVTHKYPALSLDKTKEVDTLKSWMKDKKCVLSWKCDGLTAVATYQNGKLVLLATRGNGHIGEDVTHNAPYIIGLPLTIPVKEEVVVRGEVMISYHDFKAINEKIENPDERYMNPRNLASSSLRLVDSWKAKDRRLQFRAFTLVSAPKMPDTVLDSFDVMHELGFDTVQYIPVNQDTIQSGVDDFSAFISLYQFPTDGLVLTYDDIAYGRNLGTTGKFPKNAIAFKWQDNTAETTLRDVEWSASRTGLINPVAVFDPVELEGTTVERASLHNIRYMENLRLGYGDTITIYKANMIIPQVDENLTQNGKLISVPDICPVCGFPTERRENKDGTSEFLYCDNPKCPAKHTCRFVRLVERDGLNVVGLSKATVKCLVERGFLKSFRSLYHLSDYREEIIEMEGFGEKSFEKLMKAIEKSRSTTFRQVFYAFGVPGAGHDAGKILEKYLERPYMESFFTLMERTDAEGKLQSLDGIGTVTAHAIKQWFNENAEEAKALCSELVFEEPEKISGNSLTGMTFVITGTLESYPNRNALKAEIESKGGKVSGSVSKSTSYLINNDVESTSGKNKKAKELGIPIISESAYLKKFV